MNTNLDEMTLALWLEDELEGAELTAFETAMDGDTGLIARREAVRAWRRQLRSALPAAEEPPYPEFFNSRIEQSLRQAAPRAAVGAGWFGAWRAWWLPTAALAGMALAFWLGTEVGGAPQAVVVAPNPVAMPVTAVAPAVYTPERGVAAESFSSVEAEATVIVLEGLDAIPDTLDFAETASVGGEQRATAGIATPDEGGVRQ